MTLLLSPALRCFQVGSEVSVSQTLPARWWTPGCRTISRCHGCAMMEVTWLSSYAWEHKDCAGCIPAIDIFQNSDLQFRYCKDLPIWIPLFWLEVGLSIVSPALCDHLKLVWCLAAAPVVAAPLSAQCLPPGRWTRAVCTPGVQTELYRPPHLMLGKQPFWEHAIYTVW